MTELRTRMEINRNIPQKPNILETERLLSISQITIRFNGIRKRDRTAQRAFSGTYFDLSDAITGQNAPTVASNEQNRTKRTMTSLINDTAVREIAAMVSIVTSFGLKRSFSNEPTITDSIKDENIKPCGMSGLSSDRDGVHINTNAYIDPSYNACITPNDDIVQLYNDLALYF